MEEIKINLAQYKSGTSSVFTGRPQGEEVRKKINLDSYDRKGKKIIFIIPADTTSFNPSFFLGLVFPSIKKLGMKKFNETYEFVIESDDEELISVLKKNLLDGFRNAQNTIDKNFGFDVFFKK